MWTKQKNSTAYTVLVEYKRMQNKAIKEYRMAKRNLKKKLIKDIEVNAKTFDACVKSKER
jgi:hypothetical protein